MNRNDFLSKQKNTPLNKQRTEQEESTQIQGYIKKETTEERTFINQFRVLYKKQNGKNISKSKAKELMIKEKVN